jgi:hypothetical protein
MSTTKVSTTLTEEHVAEAKARVGERGFSRYLDEALARQLQVDRLADLEQQLEDEFGPIPRTVQDQVDLLE